MRLSLGRWKPWLRIDENAWDEKSTSNFSCRANAHSLSEGCEARLIDRLGMKLRVKLSSGIFIFKDSVVEILQLAVRKLANSMRIYGEAHCDFQRLKYIDKEEAIDNLDRAFESKLEAFHSLYDVSKNQVDYFSSADTASLILMRNAIHHRDHLLFKSWNHEVALDEKYKNYLGAEFLLVDYPVLGAPSKMRYFYKLEDFYLRLDDSLSSPYLEKKMGAAKRASLLDTMDSELSFLEIKKYAKSEKYPIGQIYINIIPIFISATCRVFSTLKKNGFTFSGFDAKVYEEPFTNELEVDFSKFTHMPLRIL